MAGIFKNVLETIGRTPIVQLDKSVPKNGHSFFGKVEYFNPGGSVKDRIALAIIEEGERSGALKPGGTIIEATSGNTGVGLAMVAAIKGYKCIFVMPEKMSEEKRATLRAYGARVVITPTGVEPDDPRSHYSVAKKFVEITPNSFYTNQYHNPANAKKHVETTGPEIWEQMEGQIDVFVGGAGTGGTLSGVGRFLKSKNPDIKIVCADPIGSILHDMFYYKEVREKPSSYLVEGIGEDMMPENVHFDVWDDVVRVTDPEIFQLTRKIARAEGLLVGPSCGAALLGAIKYSESGRLKKPSRILALFPDGGRSYLSKVYSDDWMREKKLLPTLLANFTVGHMLSAMNSSAMNQGAPAARAQVQVSDSIKVAIQIMKERGLTQLPVFDGVNFVGMLDVVELLSALANSRLRPDEAVFHIVKLAVVEVDASTNLVDLESIFAREAVVRVRDTGAMLTRADLAEYTGRLSEQL